ncbi:uncharacterized protein J3D65DRAFT_673265 [Phyllosticta citribraziliensis]|uniref:Uncharacterized protein n=1 Tax=Phyllosticta citribraziliensis TaxID=989973 RepID=A0ABR1M9H5_9PEZI
MTPVHNDADRIIILTGAVAGEVDKTCSLERVIRRVDDLLTGKEKENLATATEFVIVGPWIYSHEDVDKIEDRFGKLEPQVPVDTGSVRTGDLTRSRSHSDAAANNDVLKKHELEWTLAVRKIKGVLAKMFGLTSLKWESDLPFSKEIWPVVNPDITQLSLNVFVPDAEDRENDAPHPEYFTHDDLKHLTVFRNLDSLCIYGMTESFQSIIWETAWRNNHLRVLELGMLLHPITRAEDGTPFARIGKHWKLAGNPGDKYHGQDGKGMLHHVSGYGEYLDHLSMAYARNAVRAGSATPMHSFSVKVLRLGNFVVDSTSFQHFTELEEVVFIDDCRDAGLDFDKTRRDSIQLFYRQQGFGFAGKSGMEQIELKMD